MSNNFFFARQPILDRESKIVAYELLYRSGMSNSAGNVPKNATAQVVINALNMSGLTDIIQENSKAFINIDASMLFDDTLHSIPKEHFVFELLETITFSPEVIQRVKELHEMGCRFALDDIICSKDVISAIKPILPYIHIVKLDLPQSIEEMAPYIGIFKQMNVTVLAEKVETEAIHTALHELGCDLFQGYYFAKPTIISGTKMDAKLARIFQIIPLLSKGEIEEALTIFEQDAALTLQLLRYMNSAAFSFRGNITSIRHAMTLLGPENLKQWLTLMSYAMGSEQGMHSPLLSLAQERATMMRLLAEKCKVAGSQDTAAFIGLLSLVDALFNKPLNEMLEELHVDQSIQNVLLNFDGTLGDIYTLVLSVETFENDTINEVVEKLGLDFHTFAKTVEECYRLTEEFNNSLSEN